MWIKERHRRSKPMVIFGPEGLTVYQASVVQSLLYALMEIPVTCKLCYNMYNDRVESMEQCMISAPPYNPTRLPSFYGRVPQSAVPEGIYSG